MLRTEPEARLWTHDHRLERLRISVKCVLEHERQVVGQAGAERDLEGLHALGGRHELDTRESGLVEAGSSGRRPSPKLP
eukprot:2008752-Prymnesium_polylepis.1